MLWWFGEELIVFEYPLRYLILQLLLSIIQCKYFLAQVFDLLISLVQLSLKFLAYLPLLINLLKFQQVLGFSFQ